MITSSISSTGVTTCATDVTDARICTVTWLCTDCEITSTSAIVTARMMDDNAFINWFEWSFSSIDYLGRASRIQNRTSPTNSTSFYRGIPYPTVLLTSIPASFDRFDQDNGRTRVGMLQEFESITSGTLLNETTFGQATSAGFTFEVRANPSLLEVHVIRSITPLSIFAQTLALINGAVGIGALLLRWIATRCGTHKITRRTTVASSSKNLAIELEESSTRESKYQSTSTTSPLS